MGNPQESLHAFIRNLECASDDAKERAEAPISFGFKTTISTKRYDQGFGKIEVGGKIRPYVLAPVTYAVPDLGLQAAVYPDGAQEERKLREPLTLFTACLSGNEIEVDTSRVPTEPSFSNSFWDDWRSLGAGDVYTLDIYPSAIKALREHGPAALDKKIVAVDLFGGDGEFAKRIASCFALAGQKYEVHVIDRNKKSLDTASNRSATTDHGKFVVHRPVDIIETDDIFPNINSRPDVVTAMGGLCQYIITRDEAFHVASMVYEGMRNGGIFIATGYTEMRLNAQDFREIGFRVEQMSIPKNTVPLKNPYQMYVLRK